MPDIKEITFKSDTKERKEWFTGVSFSHPAKMSLPLQIYLIEHYTKPGDTILDPMAGSGTILTACALGRSVICIELEKKFCDIMQGNWEKIKRLGPMLGYKMGTATIIQGDARQLPELLANVCCFSPPYAEAHSDKNLGVGDTDHSELRKSSYLKNDNPNQIANLKYGEIDKVIMSPPFADINQSPRNNPDPTADIQGRANIGKEYSDNPSNIGNLKYGNIDAIVTSPPYEGSISGKELPDSEKLIERKSGKKKWGKHLRLGKSQLTKYADIICTSPPYEQSLTDGHTKGRTDGTTMGYTDVICTSPPYEGTIDRTKKGTRRGIRSRMCDKGKEYGMYADQEAKDNIGNLKSTSYLEAMAQVYAGCHQVLKDNGLMILVVKNFIRNKKIVRLDLDTIRLCEQAGFTLKERLKRKLTAQSFWRTIYYKKFPDAPKIEYEDVLVFERQ